MADDPKTDSTPSPSSTAEGRWQPPEWLRGKPAEWKSTTWEEWVARDSPFAPRKPAAAPELAPESEPSAVSEPLAEPVVKVGPPPPPIPSQIAEPAETPSEPDRRQETWEEIVPRLYALLGDKQAVRLGLQPADDWVGEAPSVDELERALDRARPAEAPMGVVVTSETSIWWVGLAAVVVVALVSKLSDLVPFWLVAPLVAYFAATSWAWRVWRQRLDDLEGEYRRAVSRPVEPDSASFARARAWETLEPRLHDWLSVDLVECLTPRGEHGEVIAARRSKSSRRRSAARRGAGTGRVSFSTGISSPGPVGPAGPVMAAGRSPRSRAWQARASRPSGRSCSGAAGDC